MPLKHPQTATKKNFWNYLNPKKNSVKKIETTKCRFGGN